MKGGKFGFSKSKSTNVTMSHPAASKSRVAEEVLPEQFPDVLYQNDIEQVGYSSDKLNFEDYDYFSISLYICVVFILLQLRWNRGVIDLKSQQ